MLFAGLYILLKRGQRYNIRHIVIIFGTAGLAWLVAHFLKNIIMNPRPDLANALITPDSLYSFPSGHATFLFGLAWSMYGFDKRAGVVLFVFGALTGIARVLAGVHFWYDIVGGFIVGWIVSYIVLLITKRIRS